MSTSPYAERDRGRVVSIGSKLGPYHVALELARGGMATVYLARTVARAGLHRYVALKCIRTELAQDQSFVDMFFDEARIASQLHHPNVCGVLDFDVQDGVHFLALEHLSGQTLTRVVKHLHERPHAQGQLFQAGIVCRLIIDACEGLHAAHELVGPLGEPLNVVHRDVAPDNLFVTYDGNLKVLDFGVASAAHQHHKTLTGMIKGKCSYLAPEVLKGKKADRRADVWGLGVTAWEMLTARKLFRGSSDLETFRAICTGSIPAPSVACPGLPPALDAVVLKALERKPDARYATARELGRALAAFLVEQRLPIVPADVSDAMAQLFPEGRATTRKLLQVADQLEEASSARPAAPASPGRNVPTLGVVAPAEVQAVEPGVRRLRLPSASAMMTMASALLALVALVIAASSHGAQRGTSAEVTPRPPAAQKSPPAASTPTADSYRVDVDPVVSSSSGEVVLRIRVSPREAAAGSVTASAKQ
jgi:serine/threonine-protein kinase